MRNSITLIFIFAMTACSASYASGADVCATATNLVQNCGFETANLTGWTVSGTDSAAANYGIYYGVDGTRPYSGSYAAYLGAVGGEMTLSQTLANLVSSDVYTVTVEVSNDTTPDTGYLNDFSITLGNITSIPMSQVVAGGYTVYTLRAGANSGSPVLALNSRNDAGFWNVDSVQVVFTSTPEPSAVALFGMASSLLAGYRFVWRRTRSSAVLQPRA